MAVHPSPASATPSFLSFANLQKTHSDQVPNEDVKQYELQ